MTATAFRYRAARADGRVLTGTVEGATPTEAVGRLAERGLHALAVEPALEEGRRKRAAPKRELAAVFQGIAALVGAGVPVLRALDASSVAAGPRLRTALQRVSGQVREGRSLADGLASLEGVVPMVVVGLIRAGERASRLGPALDEAAAHLELEADLESRLQQALAYPLVLATAGVISTVVISTIVVPRFAALLADLGQQLPASTRLLLATSAFVTQWWWLGLAVLGLVGLLVAKALEEPETRRRLAEAVLAVPLLGAVRLALGSARAARAAASALAAGVPLIAALNAAGEASGDPAIRQRLAWAAADVSEGRTLTMALERRKALLPSALQLVAVGEASGRLAEMLAKGGRLAAQESERRLRALIGLLEPALVVTFGGLVAFVAAALLQAVYALRP